MYEMEGPHSASQRWAHRLLGVLALSGLPPVTDFPARGPGFPVLPPPELPPDGLRFRWSEKFYCPGPQRHKGFRPAFSRFFGHPQVIHKTLAVIPRATCLSTGSSTAESTVLARGHSASPGGNPRTPGTVPARGATPGPPGTVPARGATPGPPGTVPARGATPGPPGTGPARGATPRPPAEGA